MTIAYRWFVWNGRYTSEPGTAQTLYAARSEQAPAPIDEVTAELGTSEEVRLDDRIAVRIVSVRTFSAQRMYSQLVNVRGQYVAVELALTRIEHIGQLLVLVHRMADPHVGGDVEDELLVYRQWFSREQLRDATQADVDAHFGRDGKRRAWGEAVGDGDSRLAARRSSRYRFRAWVAHRADALALDPKKLWTPDESLRTPMCVSDRSPRTKHPATERSDEPGHDIASLGSLQALWRTRRGGG